MLSFGCIILAAGASTRMGRPKQLLNWRGKSMVARAAEAALAAQASPVIVVLGANADVIRPLLTGLPALAVENAAWKDGMASSIRAGVVALEQSDPGIEAVMIALCDQPAFSAAVIQKLLDAGEAGGGMMVAARYSGRAGAPALFLRRHFDALKALGGDEGARKILQAHPDQVVAVDLPDLAFDLDTPEDCLTVKNVIRD